MDDAIFTQVPSDILAELEVGFRLWREGALGAARASIEAALERASVVESVAGQLSALHLLGNLAFDQGDLLACQTLHSAVLDECRTLRLGVGIASSLHNLGILAARQGEDGRARALLCEAINCYSLIGRADAAARARASLRAIIAGPLVLGSSADAD